MIDSTHLRMTTFACEVVTVGGVPAPQGPSLDTQVTAFLHDQAAWPVSSSVTILTDPGNPAERLTHVLTLFWMPRQAWVDLQACIAAQSKLLVERIPSSGDHPIACAGSAGYRPDRSEERGGNAAAGAVFGGAGFPAGVRCETVPVP